MQTTVLGLAAAYSTVANGGWINTPKLILGYRNPRTGTFRPHDYPPPARVLSEKTAKTLTQMLVAVTEYGTAENARVMGFKVAGKTGTAQIFDPVQKHYSREKYLSSFVGFLPAENPRVVIAVVVNQPKGAKYGNKVAAPSFARLAGSLMKYLEVFPTEPDCRWKIAQELFQTNSPRLMKDAQRQAPGASYSGTLTIGMTMREAYRSLRRQGIPLAFQGSGIALTQEPRGLADTGPPPGALTVQFFPPARMSGVSSQPQTGT